MKGPFAAVAAWAVLSAACAGGGEPADAGDAAPAAPRFRSALIGDPAPPSEPFRLTLTSPGGEPRRALRYRVPPGVHERVRISITSEFEVFVAGRRVNRVAPPTIEAAFEVEASPRPGGYRCAAWITDTASADWERAAPGRGSELRASLEQLRGHRISFEVDERGHPVSHSITIPDALENNRDAAREILQMVDGSVVPFPAEPVGAGAVWTVTDAETGRSTLAGAVLITYTLIAVRGDRLELSMAISLPQEPAPLSFTGKETAGYGGSVTSGTIRVAVDLGRLLPDSEGTLEFDLEGRTFSGNEEHPFRVHQKTRQLMDSR